VGPTPAGFLVRRDRWWWCADLPGIAPRQSALKIRDPGIAAAQHDLAAPQWTEIRALQRPWFPAELEIQRADALVRAPAAFRKHCVYLSARDLEAA
jgi:hypothetical protein